MPEMDFDVEFGDPKKRVRITKLCISRKQTARTRKSVMPLSVY